MHMKLHGGCEKLIQEEEEGVIKLWVSGAITSSLLKDGVLAV